MPTPRNFLGPVHPGISGVDNIDQDFYQNYACGAAPNVITRRRPISTPQHRDFIALVRLSSGCFNAA
jgi:hypothetical protein